MKEGGEREKEGKDGENEGGGERRREKTGRMRG